MTANKVNFEALSDEYKNCNSLSHKKIHLVNQYIENGDSLIDIGIGTGDLIDLVKNKFKNIRGFDSDEKSIQICREKFSGNNDIKIDKCQIQELNNEIIGENFDCCTCLDVLEHISEQDCIKAIDQIYEFLKPNGVFVFSGPGIFEKIKIVLGLSPTHIHSHSPFGWKRIIKKSGFEIVHVETVEFPIFQSNFLRKKVSIFGKCLIIIAKKEFKL